jgi:hypothetical protein
MSLSAGDDPTSTSFLEIHPRDPHLQSVLQLIHVPELRMHDLLRDSPSSPPRDRPGGFAACAPADRVELEEAARAEDFDLL